MGKVETIETYGFVGESMNIEEYGSIGLGPVGSSSSSPPAGSSGSVNRPCCFYKTQMIIRSAS
jgi:hypothetical protein